MLSGCLFPKRVNKNKLHFRNLRCSLFVWQCLSEIQFQRRQALGSEASMARTAEHRHHGALVSGADGAIVGVLRAGIGAAKAQNDDAQRRYIFEAFGKRQLTPRTSSKKLPGAPVGAIRQWGWADYSVSVTSASGAFLRTDSTPFRQLSMEW